MGCSPCKDVQLPPNKVKVEPQCEKKQEMNFNIDELSKEEALEFLKKQTTSIGFQTNWCGKSVPGLRVTELKDGAGCVYSNLIVGDIVLEMDGKPVNPDGNPAGKDDLKDILAKHLPGDIIEILVKRYVHNIETLERNDKIIIELWPQYPGNMTLQQIRNLRIKAGLEICKNNIYTSIELNKVLNSLAMDVAVGFSIIDGHGDDKGVRVIHVNKSRPAYKANIRNGDIINKVNGENIKTRSDFAEQLKLVAVGQVVEFHVDRMGYEFDAEVKVGGGMNACEMSIAICCCCLHLL